jgi:hypothetical protein
MCAGRKEGSKQGTHAGKKNSMAEYAFPHITNLSMLFTKKLFAEVSIEEVQQQWQILLTSAVCVAPCCSTQWCNCITVAYIHTYLGSSNIQASTFKASLLSQQLGFPPLT